MNKRTVVYSDRPIKEKMILVHAENPTYIRVAAIESVGTNNAGETFILPIGGNDEECYIVKETVEEIIEKIGVEVR